MKGGNFGVTTGRAIRATRRNRALRLLCKGYTLDQIVNAIPEYSSTQVLEQDMRRMLRKLVERPSRDWLALQVARHERLLQAVWGPAVAGNLDAHDRALRTLREESNLLGLGKTVIEVDNVSDVGKWLSEILGDGDADDIEEDNCDD